MAERVLTQTPGSTAIATASPAVTTTLTGPGAPGREGVTELQSVAGNAATRKALPEASAERVPTVLEAARNLNVWLHTGNADSHVQQITRTLMLLQDQRPALEAEFESRANETLAQAIRGHMSGTARVRAQRIHERGRLDLADEIYFAAKGAGTEKGTLARLLKEASADRPTVEQQFHERYKGDYGEQGELPDAEHSKSWIAGMLDAELSFKVEASWEALPRAKAIYRYGAPRAIDEVHLAIVGPGTNTAALFAALGKLAPEVAKDEYKKSYLGDLEQILTTEWTGELSLGDRDRALAYFKGDLDLVKTVASLIGTLSTDEDAIFEAIAGATTVQRQKLRAELDKRPMTELGERYHGRNSGLDADDKRRINALLSLPGAEAQADPRPAAMPEGGETASVITLLQSEGGTSRGSVYKTIKMAPYESWKRYRDAYAEGGSSFQHYVDARTDWEEKVGLLTILSKEPGSLRKRLMWAMSGVISDDEPYLFHLLAGFTADETGEGPTRRDLATDKLLLARMEQKLSKGELTRARALMRPKDLTPAEAVAWFETDFQRADSWIGRASDSYDALVDARRELRTAFARAQAEGGISAEEARRIEQLEVRARASLDVYVAVRDEFEGYAVQAITTAVGLLLAVPSGGTSIAVLASNLARAAIYSGLTRLMAEKLVRGERFELDSNDALAAFAGGAAEGITNVVGASVAKGLTGPLIKSIENAGPAFAKIAAGKTFKALAATAETATEGAFSSVVTSTVESAAKDETWVNGFEGVVTLAGQAPGAAATGAVMAVGTDLTKKAAANVSGRVRKVLAQEPRPPAHPAAAHEPPPQPVVAPGLGPGPGAVPEPVLEPHPETPPVAAPPAHEPAPVAEAPAHAEPVAEPAPPAAELLAAAKPQAPPVSPLPPLAPGASLYRQRAHEFIQKTPDLMGKLDKGTATLDALEELFQRSGGNRRVVTPGSADTLPVLESMPVQNRAAPSEMKTLLDYAGRPDVTHIEMVPSSSAGRTPDMVVTHGDGLRERVEITTLTGAQRGYRHFGEGGSREATKDMIEAAIRRKVASTPAAPSQFTAPVAGVPVGGTLVVHVQRGGPAVKDLLAGRVTQAVADASALLTAHPEIRRLEFWLPGRKAPMVFAPQGGTFVLVNP